MYPTFIELKWRHIFIGLCQIKEMSHRGLWRGTGHNDSSKKESPTKDHKVNIEPCLKTFWSSCKMLWCVVLLIRRCLQEVHIT